jgi:glutamyl-tRNA reductase
VLLLGLSHRTAPLEVRERFAVAEPGPLLAKLVEAEEIDEAVLVSTCNRVEVVVLTHHPDAARLRLRSFFRRELGHDAAAADDGRALDAMLYELTDANAMRHVLRVASSIDSMVVGEPQILGQMKDAYHAAREADACGVILTRLFQCAFSTAKRVRRETRIAERPVSVARVAVNLARQIFEDLSEKSALLIGAGEMIEIALEALRQEGLAAVRVANRTRAHAAELAERFDASAHGLDELPALLPRSDVVLSCIGGDAPLLTTALVGAALRERSSPLFIIDIGVPRNVDPAVNALDGVYLYDLDDLAEAAAANAEERRRETVRAEAIVLEEQQRFDGWLAALQAVPTIRDLKSRAESIRVAEFEKATGRLGLDDVQRDGVEALTRAIVNKLLHAPVSRLRGQAEREDGLGYLEVARVLFDLDDASPARSADEAGADETSGEEARTDEPPREPRDDE